MSYKIKAGTWSNGKYDEKLSLKSFHTYDKAIPTARKMQEQFPLTKFMIVEHGKKRK